MQRKHGAASESGQAGQKIDTWPWNLITAP
jgi:hypothetical protein